MTIHNSSIVLCIAVLSACVSCNNTKYDYVHPIPYSPEVYVCYRAPQAPMIDGVLDENEWGLVQWSSLFVDIEGSLKPQPMHDTRMKMMWDDANLYIAAKMEDDHIWATLKQRDTIIFQNDDFEVFIDPDGDTHNYFELEINALNTVWDLLLRHPYREDSLPKVHDEWNIENLQTAVYIEGSLNDPSDTDSFWTVEIAIPINSLTVPGRRSGEFIPSGISPRNGDQWRINYSRVAWHVEVVDGRYMKKKDTESDTVPYGPQENWVWSASGYVAMHQPETWGYLQFSDFAPGEHRDPFVYKEEEQIKWGLRQLYYQQRECKSATGRYTNDTTYLMIPDVGIENYKFAPEMIADKDHFEIRAPGLNNTGYWTIRQDGMIWLKTD